MTIDPMSTNSTVLMDKYYGKLNIEKAPAVHTVQILKKESFISKLLKFINKSRQYDSRTFNKSLIQYG